MSDTSAAQRALGTQGFERREIVLSGVRTVYYEAGQGPAVIYFHGGGAFHGVQFARSWTQHFRVICPFHPGFSESDDDPRVGAMQHYVLHYLDFLDALKLDRIHLTGLSLGGRLAAEFAVSHSDRLKSLVIGAPGGLDIPEHPPAPLGGMSLDAMIALLVADMAVLSPYIPPAVPAEAFAQARMREGQMSGRVMMSPTSLQHWMHRISVPTLLLWGDQDRVLPVGRAKAWAELLPKDLTTVRIIEGIGHLVFDESLQAVQIAQDFMLAAEAKTGWRHEPG
jgi:pimeloyl-ACP methyl ester carboxylesterase